MRAASLSRPASSTSTPTTTLPCCSTPAMLPKLSQGVTTVIVGNCGISASPVRLRGAPPDPMNLLGPPATFATHLRLLYCCDPRRAARGKCRRAHRPHGPAQQPHGPPRPHRDHRLRLPRCAPSCPRRSTAARSASAPAWHTHRRDSATTEEVLGLAEPLAQAGALYTTHMRTETDAILDAMEEAFTIGRKSRVPVVDLASEVRGHCQLGPQRGGLHALDSRALDAAGRLRLLSVRGRLEHARPRPGGSARRNHDHLERAASGDAGGRLACSHRRTSGASPSSKRRGDCSPPAPSITASPRTTCAGSSPSCHHDRLRRPAQRSAAASAPVGNISARAGPLQPRREASSLS